MSADLAARGVPEVPFTNAEAWEPAYPLTWLWLALGAVAGLVTALISGSGLYGYAIFVLFTAMGLTWRRGDPPVFPFLVIYQWTQITIGSWYQLWSGIFPGKYHPGDLNRTMFLALTGLLVLSTGFRLVFGGLQSVVRQARAAANASEIRNLRALFLLVLGAYALDYVYVVNTKVYSGFDVILERVLGLRQILLLTLWYEIIRQRREFKYLWISLAWVFVPRLGSYFSDFKTPVILLLIVFATTWRPWDRNWWPRGILAMVKGSPLMAALLFLVLLWQAGIKKETRKAYDEEIVGRDPRQRIAMFVSNARNAVPVLLEDPQKAVESLVERLSYVTFFSRVLEFTPSHEPYAGGELLKMAVTNSVMPRFLFPDKPILPSDSYYTHRFTGIYLPETVVTSISIGYMAEFYADWGLRGMMISVFLYGCWIGIVGVVLGRFVKPPILLNGAMITVLLTVGDFEHQFVKGFGALNISVIVTVVALGVGGGWLMRRLDLAPTGTGADGVVAPEPAKASWA